MNQEDYIMHYGVLGMKWGQRKARKSLEKAASLRQKADNAKTKGQAKKLLKKANKYEKKSRKIEEKHKSLGGENTYNRVKGTSTAKLAVQSALVGTYGALKYHEMRAKDVGFGKSVVQSLISGSSSKVIPIQGFVEPRLDKNKKKA